jgi:hypothetical protein
MRGGVRRSPINGVHVINLRPSEPPLRARHPRTLPTDSQAVGENVRVTPCSMPRDSIWARSGYRHRGSVCRWSSRSRPSGGQHQCVAFDDQPTLGRCVSAGYFEIRHLPIAHLRCLGKIVQRHFVADPTTHGIYHDIDQSPADCIGGLPSRTTPTDPTMRNSMRDNMFFHTANSVSLSFEMTVAATAQHLWPADRDSDHETKRPWSSQGDSSAITLGASRVRRKGLAQRAGLAQSQPWQATLRCFGASDRRSRRQVVTGKTSITRASSLPLLNLRR